MIYARVDLFLRASDNYRIDGMTHCLAASIKPGPRWLCLLAPASEFPAAVYTVYMMLHLYCATSPPSPAIARRGRAGSTLYITLVMRDIICFRSRRLHLLFTGRRIAPVGEYSAARIEALLSPFILPSLYLQFEKNSHESAIRHY